MLFRKLNFLFIFIFIIQLFGNNLFLEQRHSKKRLPGQTQLAVHSLFEEHVIDQLKTVRVFELKIINPSKEGLTDQNQSELLLLFDVSELPSQAKKILLPEPIIISQITKEDPHYDLVMDYVMHWIKNPDPGSLVEKAIWIFKWLPLEKILFNIMKWLKYDGLLYILEGKVIAHTYFQIHGNAIHCFSVRVDPDFRNNGLARQINQALIQYTKQLPGIEKFKHGKNFMRKITESPNLAQQYGLTVVDGFGLFIEEPFGFAI